MCSAVMRLHNQVNTSLVFGSDLEGTKLNHQYISAAVGEQTLSLEGRYFHFFILV